MQGIQVLLYVDGEQGSFKQPVGWSQLVKSWAPTEERAREELERMKEEYGDGIGRFRK